MTNCGNRISRRRLLRSAFLGGSGLLAAYAVGCGGDDDDKASPSATGARTNSAPGLPTPVPTPGPLRWRKLTPSGDLPQGRTDHSLVTDGRSLLMFGGRTNGQPVGDFWQYDSSVGTWTQVAAGDGPAPRFGHNAVYDRIRLSGMVIFGGQGANNSFFNDIWALDNQAPAWRLLDPGPTVPASRYGAASALSAEGRLVISHGFTDTGRFDDTWSFGGIPPFWDQADSVGARPVKRCLVRAVWDIQRSRFLMFGGQTDGTPFLGDTWIFGADGWREITTEPKPSPRNFYSMVFDDADEQAILFGGNSEDGPGPVNDLWFFDAKADNWSQPEVEGEPPSARYGHDAVWLAEERRMIVFGGHDDSGDLNDIWELSREPA